MSPTIWSAFHTLTGFSLVVSTSIEHVTSFLGSKIQTPFACARSPSLLWMTESRVSTSAPASPSTIAIRVARC